MKKVLIVFGTRPEAIKMAPLHLEFLRHKNNFQTKLCVTGQHRQMLDQVLEVFEIVPDYDLNVMKRNQTLSELTSNIILGLESVFADFQPDYVFVHGDTTTTLATSLAAFYHKVKICHVEAGLRTFDLGAPWPEEMNRQLTDKITDYHFAPTEEAKNNLIQENIDQKGVFVVGNTVIDALLIAKSKIDFSEDLRLSLQEKVSNLGFPVSNRKFILITGHRRENFGEGFLEICEAIRNISYKHKDFDIVYPVHLNSNVQQPVYEILSGIDNVYLIPPLDYLPFIYLLDRCHFVLTDSGGIQEEAPTFGKPVLVMRDQTERKEAIMAGTALLVGTSKSRISENVSRLIEDEAFYENMAKAHNPFGAGDASRKITEIMLNA